MQPKPVPREAASPERAATHLCDSCLYGADCHLQEMPTQPVHECLEYDDGTLSPPPVAAGLAAVSVASEAPAAAEGLCVNCDHRETCTLARPAGGVWHCEEYR